MNRFSEMLLLGLFALAVIGAPFSVHGKNIESPDILFISIDDLNDWVSPLDGHPQAITPNMERLASRGIVFTNAHSPAVICNPSRAAFLSGLRPSTTGIYGNLQNWETNEVANLAAFLLSPKSSGINGQGIVIDAGMGMNYFDSKIVESSMKINE